MENNNLKETKVRGYITPKFVIFIAKSETGVGVVGRSRGFKRKTNDERDNVTQHSMGKVFKYIAN